MDVVLQYFEWVLFLFLLALGFFTGRYLEARHYRSIREREKLLTKVLVFATRFPPNLTDRQDCQLVSGSVVISPDYFKQFVAGLRNLVGGRFRGYEPLFDRARREAVLRMKEDAYRNGYTLIINVKFENTSISGGSRGAMPSFELFVYGTALKPGTHAI